VDKTLLLFLFGVLLFASPLVGWWTTPGTHWLTSYVLWAVLIGLIAVVVHRDER
jgi:peptidoglycan/LPS O-acetylase OafA/YrhL